MYSPFYRTPRLYLSGYLTSGQPLQPKLMMEDIVGDYKDKTVTLEDFPFFANSVKMASVHPCKHASVMKTLLDRADAALKLRRDKLKAGIKVGSGGGMEGLVDEINKLDVSKLTDKSECDEWEDVGNDYDGDEVAIRVDQYLVVFLKVSVQQNAANTGFVRFAADFMHSSLRVSHQASSMTSLWASKGCGASRRQRAQLGLSA